MASDCGEGDGWTIVMVSRFRCVCRGVRSLRGVLSEASVRTLPSSYFGSVAPYVAPFISLLESWSSHPKSEVRRWVSDTINSLQAFIREEARNEEESSVGLP